MYIVYIIQSDSTGKYYVGVTADFEQRLRHHNSGANRSTKGKGPWRIVYKEAYIDTVTAWKRERQIKKYKSGEAFKRLIHGEVA